MIKSFLELIIILTVTVIVYMVGEAYFIGSVSRHPPNALIGALVGFTGGWLMYANHENKA